jgi:hypothetical protein
MSQPTLPAHLVAEARDEIAKLDGTGRYATPSNPCWNDAYFAASLAKKYGMTVEELRRAVAKP